MLADDRRYSEVQWISSFKISSYITNHCKTGPSGNSQFCLFRISMSPEDEPRETKSPNRVSELHHWAPKENPLRKRCFHLSLQDYGSTFLCKDIHGLIDNRRNMQGVLSYPHFKPHRHWHCCSFSLYRISTCSIAVCVWKSCILLLVMIRCPLHCWP